MLHATPQSIFSWDYTVLRGRAVMAQIDMSWFRERAEVEIGDQTYSVHRESIVQGTFVLQSRGQVLARAQKVSAFSRAFDIDCAGQQLELKAVSIWTRQFGLFRNGRQIGRIGPRGWLGRSAVIDLPGDISVPVQVFLFWLVLVLWRRAASSSS
jgi:hypothetical protein